MAPFLPKFPRRAGVACLGLLAWLSLAPRAWSQHTPDPFNGVGEYNAGLEPFLYATYPNSQGFYPGQGSLSGRTGTRQTNRFQDYMDNLDGSDAIPGPYSSSAVRRSGPGVPYYSAYRQYDQSFGRVSAPSAGDEAYARDQQARNDKYFQYLKEPDPKKRAQLYREYQQGRARVSRDLSGPRHGTAAGTGTGTGSNRGGSTSAPPYTPGTAPSRTRRGASPAGPSAPGLDAGPQAGLSGPAAPRAPSASGSPSDVLRRSELLDRANRAVGRPSTGSAPPTRRAAPSPDDDLR